MTPSVKGRRWSNLALWRRVLARLNENRDAIIAILALAVSLWAAWWAREAAQIQKRAADDQLRHNVLSVTPYVIVKRSGAITVAEPTVLQGMKSKTIESGKGTASYSYNASIVLRNEGLGPAIITRIRLFIDGKEYDGSELDPLLLAEFERLGFTVVAGTRAAPKTQREALRPTAERPILSFRRLIASPDADNKWAKKLDEAQFSVDFESLYGECFEYDSRREPPTRKRTC